MALIIRPSYHVDEWRNRTGALPAGASYAPEITVDTADDMSAVVLEMDPLFAETLDDRTVDRVFSPQEARQLAAALWHFADELDRQR